MKLYSAFDKITERESVSCRKERLSEQEKCTEENIPIMRQDIMNGIGNRAPNVVSNIPKRSK
jgi:hypothetical protein